MFRAFPVNPMVRIGKLVAALKTIQETAERVSRPASVEAAAATLNLIAAIAREARAAELEHAINV